MMAPPTFGEMVRSYRERTGKSGSALAAAVGVDTSYLNRLEHGIREPPRLHVVRALAQELRLTVEERNKLYVAAGHLPPSLSILGAWDDVLEAVVHTLTNPSITPEGRMGFRSLVLTAARNWGVGAMASEPPKEWELDLTETPCPCAKGGLQYCFCKCCVVTPRVSLCDDSPTCQCRSAF